MNTSHLKKFAQEARRKLLEQVGAKLNFVLTTDSAELREKTEQLKQLRQELGRTTKEQLIEKVAYTWFNRLMALRFMDVNDYQPLGIRIITPKDGYTIPELLDEAKRGNIPDELKVNRQRIYDLLDNKIPSTNPQNEAYKELLIATCNHLHTTFPFLFERINDYTELLLPDDLTSDFSVVKDVKDGMLIEDCFNVEIIGWLYQFYISEKKDEVFASKSKVKKEDIPAATQLFTPRWIVEYMVQNTLGKLWLQNRPKSSLREQMPYFIESTSLEAEDYLKIQSPEEIKLADPASGSGHILVYAFDLFTKIYEEEGYSISEIPKLIIETNLFGFEIDERAAQLSGLALMMKARKYQRKAFSKAIKPNIMCYEDLLLNSNEVKEILNSLNIKVSDEMMHDIVQMQEATNYGSIIIPHADKSELITISNKLTQSAFNSDVFLKRRIDALISAINQLIALAKKFHCVVANPPYMGGSNMNPNLSDFVKSNYPDSKADLMACFMESGLAMLQLKGFLGMINQHSWMFLSSYERLRKRLIDSVFFDTLLHLGARTFPEISGEVVQNASFTIFNNISEDNGNYIRLVDFDKSELKRSKTLAAIQKSSGELFYSSNQKDFNKIPSSPFGYWVSNKELELYDSGELLSKYTHPAKGIDTGENDYFLRFWFETNYEEIDTTPNPQGKWVFYNKGGEFRRWYGNRHYVLRWGGDGKELEGRLQWEKKKPTLRNKQHWFKKGFTWTTVSGGGFSARFCEDGFLFDNGGCTLFAEENLNTWGALINSIVADRYFDFLSPTLNFQPGGTGSIAVNTKVFSLIDIIEPITECCIELSKADWNAKETSFDFTRNNLIIIGNNQIEDLDEIFDLFKLKWKKLFFELQRNEERLNEIFIQVYDLKEEITPIVQIERVTILQDELSQTFLPEFNKKLIRDPETHYVLNYNQIELPFIASEIMAQFISYSVGCMLGRYSLNKDGLILSNQGESLRDYMQKISKSRNECIFLPDEDNIIPILDDEWFEDDIVGKFNKFLRVTFGEKYFNKNLAFIEEHIGKDIRKYFIKDFYPDHIKRYKKRPIYWMFSSPKGSFNVLIYMHRYTPDTVSNILNKYLKEFIGKLNTRKEHLERVKETGSASDKTKAIKESDNIQKMLVELHEYERDILYPLATERTEIDLDDGVLVNYNKFGKAVKEVNGLNDPATKKKVKQFDWIDTSQIK